MSGRALVPDHPHNHAVQFYGSDESLVATVAGFLSHGLVDCQPAIVIATAAHRQAILRELKARSIDVDAALRAGDLIVLDAERILAQFMRGGMPDAEAFQSCIGGLIDDLLTTRSRRTLVRAYGEMVDVLWKQKREEAAIRLEALWNRVAAQYGLALLCGYAACNFHGQTTLFEEVCRQHTHVMPADVNATLASARRRPLAT